MSLQKIQNCVICKGFNLKSMYIIPIQELELYNVQF